MRGLNSYERNYGIKRFFLRWRNDEGRKVAKAFASAEQRNTFARSLMAARKRIGKQALSFDPDAWVQFLRFRDIVGAVDPLVVAREWLALRRGGAVGGVPVAEALRRYFGVCERSDEARSLYRKRLVLGRWLRFAGTVALRDCSPERVRNWMARLQEREGFGAVTTAQHRKVLSAFFKWCVSEELCASNPCAGARPPKIILGEVSVLPVGDAERLFAVNAREPVAARLALEAFGGLRFSHAGRIERGEIDFERRGIILAADKHKSRRRGYLEGLPDNLWKWLEAAPAGAWEMSLSQYMHAKSAAFKRAGVANAGNVLRHSFGSYLLALTDDSARVAAKMQHTSPAMLYRHYKGVASAADAARWFAIAPK